MMEPNNRIEWETVTIVPIEDRKKFWRAISLSVIKPHLINRRLAGAEQICVFRSNNTGLNVDRNCINRIVNYIDSHINDEVDTDFLQKALHQSDAENHFQLINSRDISKYDLSVDRQILVILNKLLPKNLSSNKCTFEINILDSGNNQAGYLNLHQNQTTGFIKRLLIHQNDGDKGEFSVMAPNVIDDDNSTRQKTWIKHIFIPKISKWIVSMDVDYEDGKKTAFDTVESLSLINLTEYNLLYNELKMKYGEYMVKIWPEKTDPLKFVYEDVAIATYLILLWREERRRTNTNTLQSFVDLGCGNGLLVYILSGEGHMGYGIDVRKRGIWDFYPKTTILKTLAIVPSDRSLFPDVDWIIGNHSDELSPWIPVISARSSYISRYFLLPCCAFEFNGKKFQRRNCNVSQYMDFLSYAHEISDVCGFNTQIDRLKIPSTKRICLIGSERMYKSTEQSDRENQIQEFINAKCKTSNDANNWNNDFQPRSDVEKVQNCSKVDKSIQNEIVDIVFTEVIKKKRFLNDSHKPMWNMGGKVMLIDLAKMIPHEKLKALKSECGGLQTLLKNHSQIFRVIQGAVEIKVPIKWSVKKRQLEAKGIEVQLKQKPCWFHYNHPDGCPLADDDCSFSH